MIENRTYQNKEILSDEEYFNQLDLLFELYKLKKQQKGIKRKLKEIKKRINRRSEKETSMQFKALKFLSTEINQKINKVTLQLKEPYNFFKLTSQIKNINNYISELNKSLKRREIDMNTHMITLNYYKTQLHTHKINLRRIKIIAEEYIYYLKNQMIELRAENSLLKNKMSRKIIRSEEYEVFKKENSMKKDIDQKILLFLTENILKFKPK